MNTEAILEFTAIKEMLANNALSQQVKDRCMKLAPGLDETLCHHRTDETTAARKILDAQGNPPVSAMSGIDENLTLCEAGAMLLPSQLESVRLFASSCERIRSYLKKGETIDDRIAPYGRSLADLTELRDEIERCIRNDQVDRNASGALRDIDRKMDSLHAQIKEKLAGILRGNPSWFSDSFVSERSGRFVLPVKREFRTKFQGSVIEISSSGATCFMEPSSVEKLQTGLAELRVEEDQEIRRILYTLTAMVDDAAPEMKRNMEAMQELDFIFAKAKLSASMDAAPVTLTTERRISIVGGRHPLLRKEECVPLDFQIGGAVRGVIITGPNTGGKTVALKTVGLLSMMAQSGLHIPAERETVICMHRAYFCDIGDGQSISQNLSTFSGHMKNVIGILSAVGGEDLVLLDELGSGTDPAEGMGIAVAVLEELRKRECLYLVTTHYPQVKAYAENEEGVVSARMAFDRETLSPLYRLEMGRSGESCALYIAQRLGLPVHLLKRAYEEAYRKEHAGAVSELRFDPSALPDEAPTRESQPAAPGIVKSEARQPKSAEPVGFVLGDSVIVYPSKEIGIVFQPADPSGRVGIQVKGKKQFVNHKRLKLSVPASELYPEGYDLAVVLDSVENRKARHQMGKRHRPDLQITYDTVE